MGRSPEQLGFVEQESSMPFVTREASKAHKKHGGELPGWLQLTKTEKLQLIDAITSKGVVPVLEQFPHYQEALDLKREKDISGVYLDMINTIRLAYGLSEYVPPVESPDPEEGNELGESAPHEITWQKPRNENGGESDPKQKPGHIRLTNNEFKNELTLGKGDKESGRDPSTYIIPTFGRLLGIPEGDDKGALEYKLRLAIEANDKNIPEELQRGELNPENISIWRQKIGLEPLNSEEPQIEEESDSQQGGVPVSVEDLTHSESAKSIDERVIDPKLNKILNKYPYFQDKILPKTEINPSGLDPETETLLDGLPGAEELARELGDVANSIAEQETGGKLARIEGKIYPGEGELETLDKSAEIEQLKQESLQAIATYQQFAQEHPYHTRDKAIHKRYCQLEAEAWEAQNKLAHINGGEIFALPQQRDIELSHPEAKDTKDYLESLGYGFDENGNIITIKHHNKNIELNRPYSVANLIDKARPARILTHINLDNIDTDLHHTGYVIPGLNQHTSGFIVSTLSKDEFIQGVIVDDTNISLSTLSGSEAVGYKSIPDFEKNVDSPYKINITDLRVAYARAEEFYNRNRSDESAKLELERLRGEYNQTVEEVIGIMAAQGLESEIHRVFTQEVKNLREERIVQSQELQSGFEKAINPLKERFVNFAIKHKKTISRLNLVAFGVGTTLALTGFGLPVAGGLAVLRRSVSSLMSGVSSRELARAGFEDGSIKINKFGLNINFQAAIPKLVGDSLQEGYIKKANDAELSTKLSTLEAYYRLNGGKFTNESQQTAYEAILNELGTRVQHDSIAKQVKQESSSTNTLKAKDEVISSEDINNEVAVQGASEKFVFSSPEQNQQYTSRLLTTLSEKRITELQKQQQKRKTADIIGFATGGTLLTIGTLLDAHRASVASKPDTLNPLEQPSGTSQPNIETNPPSATNPSTPEGTGEAVPQNLSPEQLQDISQLSKGETLWGEIAKQLGPNASPDQIQHALENYVQSGVGQNTMFQLAQGTEGGRGLLAQWGIDNANEMASLSKEQLYEVSRYLGPGQLEGISHFNIDHLEAFQPTEYVAPSPAEAPTIDPGYPETSVSSPVGTESLGSEPSVPPTAEAPVATPSPEVPPVATSEFTRDLSEALGTTNLTETQLQEAIYSFATSEQGSVELYSQIISNEEGARFLSGFGVNRAADFANLRPNELYEIAQTMGVENLDQLPGFELNDIILAKFENAPDTLTLVDSVNGGTRPLSLMDNYIAKYAGDLPGSGSLGKLVLEKYVLETDEGKVCLYDAIQNHQAPNSPLAFELQQAKELFSREGIKAPADLEKLLVDRNGNPSAQLFWEKLSRVLKPGQMPGIKKALQLVLTKQ
jgi:hypothetical protein